MALKDILLVLITYPQATDASEIQEAVSFAVALDARISALACIVQVRAPSQHLLSDAFVAALVAWREGEKLCRRRRAFGIVLVASGDQSVDADRRKGRLETDQFAGELQSARYSAH